jgi:hypothetical protein
MATNPDKSVGKKAGSASPRLTIDDAIQSIREIDKEIEKLFLEKKDSTSDRRHHHGIKFQDFHSPKQR